ncbi:alpha/beta hydrolase [Ferrovibrio sp.]|uniref:alpha/beta hydrolase n=1 Tax=Ferrovibrio sp. TaxID=1917215 RepID=UPI000CB8B122|nr:alpha/beta hydrolase [Ferrovibrio sp.]PJI43596.1 MAG: esterase [Ferrovibrio sp.]
MSFDWRKLSRDQLEAQYNPRSAVPDFQQHFDAYSAKSAATREAIGGDYDLRYGAGPLQTYDLHKPKNVKSGAPLVVVIHGGYWRGLDKNTMTFALPPYLDRGAVVVNLNYDLCPQVTLDAIVRQMQDALVHVAGKAAEWGADPAKLHVIGHSAGAHLAAMMVAAPWPKDLGAQPAVASLGLISGVFSLEPVLQISVNESIRLDSAMAARNSVTNFPPKIEGPVLVSYGADEPEAWRNQSIDFHQACRDAGIRSSLLEMANGNHFTIKFAAADPKHPLGAALLQQVFGQD